MGAHSSRSRKSKDVIIFRHDRFFTDPSVADLYPDYDPEKPLDQYKDDKERDAGWSFRRIKTRLDTKATRDLMVKPGVDMDALLQKREKAEGAELEAINAQIEEGTRTTYPFAELECLSVETYGPYFRLDDDFTMADFHGDDHAKDAKKLHPLAGQCTPVDPDWLDRTDEVVWRATLEAMNEQHGGRTPDGRATFRA